MIDHLNKIIIELVIILVLSVAGFLFCIVNAIKSYKKYKRTF
jgi:hypothetical protein